MTFHYLATPYTEYRGGLDEAYRDALAVAADLMKMGFCVYSPIVHMHPVMRAGDMHPFDNENWLALDGPFMRAATSLIVVMLPGWKKSKGMRTEIEHFTAMGKTIRYYDPGEKLFEPMTGFERSFPPTPDPQEAMCVTVSHHPPDKLEITLATTELAPRKYSISRGVAAALIESLARLLA